MASNEDILNAGFPKFPDPPLEPPGPSAAATRYGNALIGVQGTEDNPTSWGRYLRRIPEARNSQTVTANDHVAADPGEVTNVVALSGSVTGTKSGRPSGVPDTGEVRIAYDGNGVATITFNNSDAVTECAYNLMVVPQEIIDVLNATSNPP